MTKKFIFGLISLASFGAMAQDAAEAAPAQESDVEVSFSIDQTLATKYVWRGLTFNENLVNQGGATVAADTDAGTFAANVWYNLDLHDENDEEFNMTEVDYTFSWEKEFDMMTLGAGVITYQFPEADTAGDTTTEIYASLGLGIILSPSVTVYYDVDNTNATYVSFGAGHDIELEALNTTLSLGAALGYASAGNGENFNADNAGDFDGGFTDFAVTASVSFDITESLSISPFVTVTTLMDDARTGNDEDDNIFAGVSASYSF